MVLRLYLVRHGETEWSLAGRHTGRSDIPLNAKGEADARKLASRLASISFAHVLSSPRQRAYRTCELAGLGAAAIIEPDLSELDYGDYEGKLSAEIRKDRAGWNVFRDGCPNGETPAQVAARADRLLVRLESLGGDIALFSHGHFGAALAARWIGLPLEIGRNLALDPGALSILGYAKNHPDVRVIALWNSETP